MIKLNKRTYLDKLHACWLGKNIGGTMGAPYEGKRQMLDVSDFKTESNSPMPNDDLDLQLVWLCAVEENGADKLTSNTLADYWIDWLPVNWNEYGICKTNLRLGLLPPMSGEVDNDRWKRSNGAWIRSEIWASLAPGAPDVAVKYAVMDGMVDHGISEGVCAEIFTAGMQSLAYVESDINVIIESALSKIPETSMTAKTVRLVIDCYNNGVPYREARERVVKFNKELGWFQAPGNIGFVIIGLLYGEGDYKKSICYAINCGDDTDCTGATVGSTLGIIGGTDAIPDDMKKHIGDRIVTISINGMYSKRIPKTCEELAERVFNLVPSVMKANDIEFEFTDGEEYYPDKTLINTVTSRKFLDRAPYSYDIDACRSFSARIELDDTPKISEGEERQVTVTFFCKPGMFETKKLQLRLIMPDGWTCGKYDKTLQLEYSQPWINMYGIAKTEFTVTAGESINSVNRIYVEITGPTFSCPVILPITFVG